MEQDDNKENYTYNLNVNKTNYYSKYFLNLKDQDLPSTIDLRDKFQKPYKQGKLGSCTANALCGLIGFLHPSFYGSRLFLYYNERELKGSTSNDNGANLSDGLKCLENTGICSEEMWPYNVNNFTNKPSIECYEFAKLHKLKSARILDNFIEIKKALANNYPFVVGIKIYDTFEKPEVSKTGIVSMPNKSVDKLLGGHAVICCGYTNIDNEFYWIMLNSWGINWGDKGYCYIPFSYMSDVNQTNDLWTLRTEQV
jgi:C1A family cysteine protease